MFCIDINGLRIEVDSFYFPVLGNTALELIALISAYQFTRKHLTSENN